MYAKPIAFVRSRVIVEPPEVRFRVERFAFVETPCGGLDLVEDGPPRIIERGTSSAKRTPNAIWRAESRATRQPEASKPSGRPLQELQTMRRKLKGVEDSRISTPQ